MGGRWRCCRGLNEVRVLTLFGGLRKKEAEASVTVSDVVASSVPKSGPGGAGCVVKVSSTTTPRRPMRDSPQQGRRRRPAEVAFLHNSGASRETDMRTQRLPTAAR
ncbi:hypothetical protein MRX96_044578 [Rhipicephalus microplus]